MAVGTGYAVKGQWTNADGLPVKFPPVYVEAKQRTNKPADVITDGVKRQLLIPFDLTLLATGITSYTTDRDNDGTTDGFSIHDPNIPADASVLSAHVVFSETAVGGTDFVVGTYREDGTIVDIDAFVTATENVTANMTKGKTVVGAGVACNASSGVIPVMSDYNVWPAIKVNGTYSAGKGFVVIEYIDVAANPELEANT